MNSTDQTPTLPDPEIVTYDRDELVFAPAAIVTRLSDCDC
jgi:hypothetical protein